MVVDDLSVLNEKFLNVNFQNVNIVNFDINSIVEKRVDTKDLTKLSLGFILIEIKHLSTKLTFFGFRMKNFTGIPNSTKRKKFRFLVVEFGLRNSVFRIPLFMDNLLLLYNCSRNLFYRSTERSQMTFLKI
ncbi:hypothetical protein BpHYR1_037638 [Brachionus plicatilis]|uniref:Uncharacterized protein n=1 Tax=Brachionus plicatilis TaxID=10195 RepID=A0A3M7SD13_BRAPC|nr:hypothetical protein BpHYR1_037638 [Brachionus plicatilis]